MMEETLTNVPTLDEKKLLSRYKTIRPIVRYGDTPRYLRTLTVKELVDKPYDFMRDCDNVVEEVDFSELAILEDITVMHAWKFYTFIGPTVSEVLAQMPRNLVKKAVAFETLYAPRTYSDSMLFQAESDRGYCVCVVRLYQARPKQAPLHFSYPANDSKLPTGMDKESFKKLKEIITIDF